MQRVEVINACESIQSKLVKWHDQFSKSWTFVRFPKAAPPPMPSGIRWILPSTPSVGAIGVSGLPSITTCRVSRAPPHPS